MFVIAGRFKFLQSCWQAARRMKERRGGGLQREREREQGWIVFASSSSCRPARPSCAEQTCSRCLQSPSSGRYRGSCQQPCWPSYFPQTIVKCICLICQKYLSKLSNAFPMSPPSSRTRGSWWAPCRRSYFPQTPTLTNQPLHTIATITLYTFHHLFLIIALGIRFLSWIDIDLFQRERERATERMRVNVLCGWGGNGTLPWLSGQSYSLFIQARTPTNAITNKSENVGDRRGSSCCSSSLSNLKS